VVARKDGERDGKPLPLGITQPPQNPADRERKEGAAIAIGRRSATSALVQAGRPLAAEVVPGRRLMAAERPKPVGEAEKDDATRLGDAQHLAKHPLRIRHMFENV
jgi:hypothetical protein